MIMTGGGILELGNSARKVKIMLPSFNLYVILLQLSLSLGWQTPVEGTSEILRRPELQMVVLDGKVNESDTRFVNSSVEYVYQYTFNTSLRKGVMDIYDEDIRVYASTTDTDVKSPVLFVIRQEKAVVSWALPVLSPINKTKTYNEASRTLCGEVEEGQTERTIYVSVSTASEKNVAFTVKVSLEHNFIMRLNESTTTEVSPLSPRFFRFVFPKSPMNRFVLLEVTSEDNRCMTVSVQNASCPILDQENNVQFEGYWQTMTQKAGMTLRKENFPDGFYVVFVMHSDDSQCGRINEEETDYASSLWNWFEGDSVKTKTVTFIVTEKISGTEYIAAIFGTVGIFLSFYVFSFVVSCAYLFRSTPTPQLPFDDEPATSSRRERHLPPLLSSYPPAVVTPVASTPISSEPPAFPPVEDNDVIREEPSLLATNNNPIRSANGAQRYHNNFSEEDSDGHHWLADSDSSLDETDIDMLEDAFRDKNVYRASTSLCVAALSRKNTRVLAKKSQLYLWTLLTVGVFYGLPVVQLVFTYQKVLHTTGNQDLCYYNYLCSHPLWLLSDFNHVYSNIGYIMLGILFLLLVLRRERMHERLVYSYPQIESTCGIPRHFGLFYAMGVALIMEGCLSACYHVCPNHSNFQFDTCFMYVNAMLLMLKIYQTRHPDINASAYMAFAALAIVVLLGVVGVLAANFYFWVAFTVFHVCFGLYLSVQIYYLGRWRLDCGIFRRVYNSWKNDCIAGPLTCLRPLYIDRMILLIVANLSNWAVAWFGFWYKSQDFASHLLMIFMVNLFLYSNFYIIMKLTHREKITFQPLVYIILSIVFWTLAMYVFVHRSTSWQLTPAESRTYNRECMLLRFYDTHDVWHFLSAASIFFSFMILLTLDDDLMFVPRNKIPVF